MISYDRLILDTDLDYYVSFDSVEVGQQQGEALAEKLAEDGNPTGPIVKINGDPKDNNATLFKAGLQRGVRGGGRRDRRGVRHPRLAARERPARDGAGDHGPSARTGSAGVYAANDGTAGGAIAALKAAGIDPADVPVTGQDAELAAIQRIIAGEQFMTVYKPIKPLAESAARARRRRRQRRGAPGRPAQRRDDNGTETVPTVFLETVAVTKDNVQDTIIADDFWPVDEICVGPVRAGPCKQAGIE